MSKTYDDFLDALKNFRKLFNGDKSIDMERDIVLKFIAFLKDKDSDFYILADRENNALATEEEYKRYLHLYTSLEDIFEASFDGKNIDYLLGNAYKTFSDILRRPDIDAVMINDNKYPPVFVPKDVMQMMVFRVDHEEEYQKILKEENKKETGFVSKGLVK